jgi:hypothetical protein
MRFQLKSEKPHFCIPAPFDAERSAQRSGVERSLERIKAFLAPMDH